jgi:hypothetical protein
MTYELSIINDQVYSIMTNVIGSGAYLSRIKNQLIAWSIAGTITAITVVLQESHLPSIWT